MTFLPSAAHRRSRVTLWLWLAMAAAAFSELSTSILFAEPPAQETPAQTQTQYLSGRDSAQTVPWEFRCTAGTLADDWTTLPVPSCWEMFGFGRLRYGLDALRDKAANKVNFPPAVIGSYRHRFQVPPEWRDRRIAIVFDGAMTDAAVSVNGQSAGPTHQGAFYRFEYDITGLVKVGAENLLEVTVADESANYSVNRAERNGDFWVFGGIFRPVWLKATPIRYIDRVAIDARADGEFRADVFPGGQGAADALECQVLDAAGKPFGAPFADPLAGGHLTGRLANPTPWTAETPQLYTAVVRLKAGVRVVHEVRQRFGFRTVEVRPGDGVYVNGRRMLLRGVDRHSFWPTTGRALSEGNHRLDIATIKDMNMNAVRMSHYPPDERFLELCDEQGLYVIDELTGWQANYDDETGTRLVREMLVRDVNHPSILFWANGNEGGFNKNLDTLFPQLDPQARQVLHPWAKFGPLDTKHYPTYGSLQKLLAGPDLVMPTEILHGLYDGGHGAGLADYWAAFRASKVGAGCFLWSFADEGVKAPGHNHDEVDVNGNKAPDGILGPFHEKEGSYDAIKEIWSPVQWPQTLPAGFDGTLEVENRYDFTNLSQLGFRWELQRAGSAAGMAVVAARTVRGPDVAPGKTGRLPLGLPPDYRSADALALTALDAKGAGITTVVWPLHPAAETAAHRLSFGLGVQPMADGDAREYRAAGTVLRVSATDGRLLGLAVGGRPFPLTSEALPGARWSMDAAGWIRLNYRVEPPPDSPAVPVAADPGPKPRVPIPGEVGIAFSYPEAGLRKKTWLGAGPSRVWKNRIAGPRFGVWETPWNDTSTGDRGWIYPEFAGYFADVRWADLQTADGTLSLVIPDEKTFLRVGTPAQAAERLRDNTAVKLPPGNIAVLRDIPPMGNKFHRAVDTGPQSTTPLVTAPYEGTVYLRLTPAVP